MRKAYPAPGRTSPMGIDDLAECDGWRVEGVAARVHYRGDGGRFSVEYYAPTERVVYWRVDPEGDTAVPVDREDVPGPLRERIREDLAAAELDPEVEGQTV